MANVAFFVVSQAVLLALVLLTLKTGNRPANRLLAAFLLAGSGYFLAFGVAWAGIDFIAPGLWALLGAVVYGCPPLLMLYTKALTTPDFRRSPRFAWHFLPVLVVAAVLLVHGYRIQSVDPGYAWRPQINAAHGNWVRVWYQVSFLTLLAVYGVAALRTLRAHRRAIRDIASALEDISLLWLQRMIILAVLVAVTVFGYSVYGFLLGRFEGAGFLVLGFFTVFFYAIAFAGIRQSPIFVGTFRPVPGQPEPAPPADLAEPAVELAKKYPHSSLAPASSQQLWLRLEACMDSDSPYLQSGLRIAELAEQLAVSVDHLSQTINIYSPGTFFDYINGYRVRHAMQQLTDPALVDTSVLDIALGAGFNSLSSFYQLFKAETGQTPAKFRKAHLTAS